MDKKNDILTRIDRRSGMTVPEGYFADFSARMAQKLPERPTETLRPEPKRSFWQQVRPYAYMAAMFAGIWCMLKVFTGFGASDIDLSLKNYPSVTTALNDEHFVRDYIVPSFDSYDIMEQLSVQEDISPEEFFDIDESVSSSDSTDSNIIFPDGTY